MNTTNRTRAKLVATDATPQKPNKPATNATTRNINAQLSMRVLPSLNPIRGHPSGPGSVHDQTTSGRKGFKDRARPDFRSGQTGAGGNQHCIATL